jgi:hypothetical protein
MRGPYMCNIGRLDQVFNNDSGLAVDRVGRIFVFLRHPRECLVPPSVPELFQVLVHDIRRHDCIDNKRPEAFHFSLCRTKSISQVLVIRIQKEGPGQFDGSLFSQALPVEPGGQFSILLCELSIRYSRVILRGGEQ